MRRVQDALLKQLSEAKERLELSLIEAVSCSNAFCYFFGTFKYVHRKRKVEKLSRKEKKWVSNCMVYSNSWQEHKLSLKGFMTNTR
jgi:hypothetical protein